MAGGLNPVRETKIPKYRKGKEAREMNIMEMNALDFLGLDYFEPEESFNGVVIVPTGEVHDSGYQRMKYVLAK